jgi:MFS family permease
MLILLATQKLTPTLGAGKAASVAVTLYVLHNVFYAGFAFVAGWLADRLPKNLLLAGGYALAGVMTLAIILLPVTLWTMAAVFVVGGIYIAVEETLEDSMCAELVDESHHGMAFGVLATVNGIGDFISSIAVGVLWSAFGTEVAFGYSAVLFFAGALVVSRVRSTPAG